MGVQFFEARNLVVKGNIAGRDIVQGIQPCATCRFWRQLPDAARWGFCSRLTDTDEPQVVSLIPATAVVRTFEDFGCNQHENRFDGA